MFVRSSRQSPPPPPPPLPLPTSLPPSLYLSFPSVLVNVWHSQYIDLFSFGRAEGVPHRVLVTTGNTSVVEGLAPSAFHIVDIHSRYINSGYATLTETDEGAVIGTLVTDAHVAPSASIPRANITSAVIPHDVPILRHAMLSREGSVRDVIGSLLSADNRSGNNAITAIPGMGGLGKTTMASRVVHDPVVLSAFTDGVAWLSIGSTPLNPRTYRDCLLTICSHLALTDRGGVDGLQPSVERFELGVATSDESSAKLELRLLHALYATFISRRRVLL